MLKRFDLNKIQEFIFNIVPEAFNSIPDDFNFKLNKYIVIINVGENISDVLESAEISLQIRITGPENVKIDIQTKALELINTFKENSCFLNYWITPNNAFYTSYTENKKFNSVLQYTIKDFNRR